MLRSWHSLRWSVLGLLAGVGSAVAETPPAPPPSMPAQPPSTALMPAQPRAAAPPRAMRELVPLTVGKGSELMGVLSPDERTLYFVSDAEGTLDIMRQSPVQSSPVPLSHGFGDAAWPQIAPDGKHIAYLSFDIDSTGDVCEQGIGELEGEDEHCWPNPSSAELAVLWWDNSSLAVLSREGLHGDFRLVRQPLDDRPARVLLARNMVNPALSPDRRWLAYIPLDKTTRDVGITFSQKTAIGIALQRFELPAPAQGKPGAPEAHAPPVLYVPRLPGVTGAVDFSLTGDYLLLTQFLNDTNRDGAIDGDDNAVVFRVPFHPDASEPIRPEDEPEQLTSGRWDCHYPTPSRRALIVSCNNAGSLDVYALPLDGAIPTAWDDARLAGEIAVARDLWTKLLLWERRLALAPNEKDKPAMVREMIALHLELGEHQSAIYYAEHRLAGTPSERWGKVIAELARHRGADLALVRGQTSTSYVDRERARIESVRTLLTGASAQEAVLGQLVISEIDEDIGEKAAAFDLFRQIDLRALTEPALVGLAARRAERLYRLRAERQSLLDAYSTFASLPALSVAERLEYAQRVVRELGRGRSRNARAQAIRAARAGVDDGSELGLLLDVERSLLTLDDSNEEAVRAEIFALYIQNQDRDRRRALVLATLRAAARAGNEMMQYQFVTSWASSLDHTDPERKNAESLYELIVLDRGYGEGRQGKLTESRGYFYSATLTTGSLEAHIGFIEASMALGGPGAARRLDEVYAQRFADEPDSPAYAFVRAYRLARELPRQSDPDRHEKMVSEVLDLLARVDEELPKQAQVHQLWGLVLHQRARRTGSTQAAADANREYELALALAHDDERLTATLLDRLGLLQAYLGNHGKALRYLQQRDEMPHIRAEEELSVRLASAESARHMGNGASAQDQMKAATQLLEVNPSLARFKPLVVDRLALSLVVASERPAARVQYEGLDHLLEQAPASAPLNRLKAKIGLAASALDTGDPRTALDALTQASALLERKDELEAVPEVVWRKPLANDYRYTILQYRALIAGLRSRAERALGNYDQALQAMSLRVDSLEERLDESGTDEDRLELAGAHQQLAALQYRARNATAAARAIERGLALSDEFDANTGSKVNDVGLTLLSDYAELHLRGDVPLKALRRDLRADLERSYSAICKYRNPRWARQRFLFQTYLTELDLSKEASP
jgi:WD40 repeat protein